MVECFIQQALTSAFTNSGLEVELMLQVCTEEQMAEVDFLGINHCMTTEDDFGFVTKDFVEK